MLLPLVANSCKMGIYTVNKLYLFFLFVLLVKPIRHIQVTEEPLLYLQDPF